MKDYAPRSFREFLALLLCMAMLLPLMPVPVAATELTDPTDETVSAVSEETTEPEESESADSEATASTEASEEAQEIIAESEAVAETIDAAGDIVLSADISIPGYTGGTVSDSMEYDCGNGVTNDGSKSYLTIVTETNSSAFRAYKQLLENSGYKLVMEKEITSDVESEPNLFASYTSHDGSYKLYTYHFPYYQETRIIVDTQDDTVEGFVYEPQSGKQVKPVLAMYGLSILHGSQQRSGRCGYVPAGGKAAGQEHAPGLRIVQWYLL